MTAAFQRLCDLRWPGGASCPGCGGQRVYLFSTRGRFKCASGSCGKQFSPTTGTVFKYHKLPVESLVRAVEIFPSCRSAADMQRGLAVNYRTAFKLWCDLKTTGGKLA